MLAIPYRMLWYRRFSALAFLSMSLAPCSFQYSKKIFLLEEVFLHASPLSIVKLSRHHRKPYTIRVATERTNGGRQRQQYLSYYVSKT